MPSTIDDVTSSSESWSIKPADLHNIIGSKENDDSKV
jgi:hypothetical protein